MQAASGKRILAASIIRFGAIAMYTIICNSCELRNGNNWASSGVCEYCRAVEEFDYLWETGKGAQQREKMEQLLLTIESLEGEFCLNR